MHTRVIPFAQGVLATVGLVVLCAQADSKPKKLVIQELIVQDEKGNRVRIVGGSIVASTRLDSVDRTVHSKIDGTALVFGDKQAEYHAGGFAISYGTQSLTASSSRVELQDKKRKHLLRVRPHEIRMEQGDFGTPSTATSVAPGKLDVWGKRGSVGIEPGGAEPVKVRPR